MIVNRINKGCIYFPCHSNLEDCTFCYCPLYPCNDDTNGGKYIIVNGKSIYDCSNCEYIHKKTVVDEIFKMIRNNHENNI